MTTGKYDYQERVAKETLDAAMNSGKAICSIFCGGGKTTVSQWIIKKFIKINGRDSKILVITENNNALKAQYLEELANAHIPIDFTFGEITTDQDVQVRVGISSSLHKLPWDSIDLLLCDQPRLGFKGSRYSDRAPYVCPR
jgi:superfamily II DNA or RNA helicase